jgi:hypothetical protein
VEQSRRSHTAIEMPAQATTMMTVPAVAPRLIKALAGKQPVTPGATAQKS